MNGGTPYRELELEGISVGKPRSREHKHNWNEMARHAESTRGWDDMNVQNARGAATAAANVDGPASALTGGGPMRLRSSVASSLSFLKRTAMGMQTHEQLETNDANSSEWELMYPPPPGAGDNATNGSKHSNIPGKKRSLVTLLGLTADITRREGSKQIVGYSTDAGGWVQRQWYQS
jgi:hypothetical protein